MRKKEYTMNGKKLVLFLIFTLAAAGTCKQQLSTSSEFLSHLFNASIKDIGAIANNFTLVNVLARNIKFLLYQSGGKIVKINSQNATNCIDGSYPTVIIVHGWTDNARLPWIQQMAALYHQKGDYNVIAVDWSIDAAKNYVYVTTAVQYVGNIIGVFLLDIAQQISNFFSTLHLIGHSLGAHVVGFAGKYTQTAQKLIDRITGLDAAGPLFEVPIPRPPTLRLAKKDGKFVDLIHTNCGLKGVTKPYGDIDFYVNKGGPIQPGCSINISYPFQAISCSHQSVHVYYSQTILDSDIYVGVNCTFVANPSVDLCNNNEKAVMGDTVSRNASGTFFVNTQ